MNSAQMGRPVEFFRVGVQYYVQGRHALLCRHESVAGSLFHQGFEVMWKAALLEPLYQQYCPGWEPQLPESQRQAAVSDYTKRADHVLKTLSHDLVKTWDQFKGLYPSVPLGAFDDVVQELDRWWGLRYPAFPDGLALEIRTTISGTAPPTAGKPTAANPYRIDLEDMDRMFTAIAPLSHTLSAIRLSIGGMRETGRGVEAYELENQHKVW